MVGKKNYWKTSRHPELNVKQENKKKISGLLFLFLFRQIEKKNNNF